MSHSREARSAARERLEGLLAFCVKLDASDLHLSPGLPPYWRIHGMLEPLPGDAALSATAIEEIATVLLAGREGGLPPRGSADGATSGPGGARFRFNVYRRQDAWSIALRRLEDRFRTLAELGLPESLYELSDLSDGLVVVAGPTGAGKSTTLATLLDRVNRSRPCHVVTIEDPIEYLHQPVRALVDQRQIGTDAGSFDEALVASLRQDPDVILVGEIRDLATIRTAITAAETGHLVFTTVHAGDCVGAIERLVSVFPAEEQVGIRRQLSLVLRAIVAQHLLVADAEPAARGGPDVTVRKRRVVLSEVLRVTPAVANLVATAKSAQIYSSMESGASFGMQTLDHDLARLLVEGTITESTALAVTKNPAILKDRVALQRRRGGTR